MRSDLPTGTVTLLFTDVGGSTRLLEELGADAYGALLAEHHRVCREAWAANGGVEVSTAGDAFFVAFPEPSAALAAAGAAQRALAPVGVAVRMGVHTREVKVTENGYIGMGVHRAARIAAAGHGWQVLVSAVTASRVEGPLIDLGETRRAPGSVSIDATAATSGTRPRNEPGGKEDDRVSRQPRAPPPRRRCSRRRLRRRLPDGARGRHLARAPRAARRAGVRGAADERPRRPGTVSSARFRRRGRPRRHRRASAALHPARQPAARARARRCAHGALRAAQLFERLSRRLDLLKAGRGGDARQQTLRATIAWSHDLLDPAERQLFRRLSVFAGGCTYGSAEDVAGADPDTLQSLLDKSLLGRRDSTGGPRFWMLETIREYAAEQLAAAGETDAIQRRHLEHYTALAADCYDETWGCSTISNGSPMSPTTSASRTTLHSRPTSTPHCAWQRISGHCGSGAAVLSARQGDWEAHDAFSLELLDLTEVLGDPVRRGRTLMVASWSVYRRGDLDGAMLLLDDPVDALDAPGGEASRRSALGHMAGLLSNLGDHQGALARQREIVAKERRDGSDVSLAFYLNNLGWMERAAGETEQARRTLEEAVALARRTGYKPTLGNSLHSLGCLLQAIAPATMPMPRTCSAPPRRFGWQAATRGVPPRRPRRTEWRRSAGKR